MTSSAAETTQTPETQQVTKVLIGDVAWTLYGTIALKTDGSGGVEIRPYRPEYERALVNLLRNMQLPGESPEALLARLPTALRAYLWARPIDDAEA